VTDGRKRIATTLATLCIAGLGGSVLTASPSTAEPSIGDVRDRVDRLYHEAEQASERYNDAKIRLDEAETSLEALEADLDRQRDRVESVRQQVAAGVVAQYQGQALSTATQVILSDDAEDFLSQMTTVSEYTARQGQVVADLELEVDRLGMREEVAQREIDAITEAEATLAEEKATIDERAAEAEALLDRLESEAEAEAAAQERAERPSRSAVRTPVVEAEGSGRAAAAVSYALAQVGDAYVYGAMGPDAFDCSGLTMMAWAQAGVSLPHSSSAQMSSGTPVSSSALSPGDLVFYYSPVSHVGIYVGNGMVAHAANPSTGVRIDPVSSMPISGAVRPG
jgi:cell wall-associated NlpC family hydrolase